MQPKQNVNLRKQKASDSCSGCGTLARCGWAGHGVRWTFRLSGRHRLAPEFLLPLDWARNALLDELTSSGNESQGFVITEVQSPLGICFLENSLVRIW